MHGYKSDFSRRHLTIGNFQIKIYLVKRHNCCILRVAPFACSISSLVSWILHQNSLSRAFHYSYLQTPQNSRHLKGSNIWACYLEAMNEVSPKKWLTNNIFEYPFKIIMRYHHNFLKVTINHLLFHGNSNFIIDFGSPYHHQKHAIYPFLTL